MSPLSPTDPPRSKSQAPFHIVGDKTTSPLVLDVSRSGTSYPPDFQPTAPFPALHRKIAPYVERVVLPSTAEGATVLRAQFPPSFVDPNRPIDDIDPELLDGQWPTPTNPLAGSLRSGSGLVHSLGTDYTPLYDRKLPVAEVQQRISRYYTPYHSTLSALLAERRHVFGRAFQLSCHSMSSIGPRDGVKRPQICLGDLNGESAAPEYGETVAKVFRDRGYEVSLNKPFPGNELLRRHASPATGIHSLQVELRRDLYLDERTWHLHEGLAPLQDCFTAIAAALRPPA
ncbi:putative hydrolase [Streptomyces albus]|uniref:Putative hydrolase n=1 Tax=Streptomyces albus (strain ATCC 21838 / DSM 41398 / FERM P-419 / JCM 4703 / NBRC 107858) TaxID=1081613 RepID=A0A0B5EM90_STRA4|nr:putative hydrolase [Streptomyces albus]AOU74785.1 putative hydrolase [Streptomyces albus]AYN30596.1 N-formylglutamate deformylase [Streptomyces albus]